MVTLVVPPFVIGHQLRIHFADECRIIGMGEYFVYSPGYERRFAVACIVFGRIGVDAVYNHAVRLLVVKHGADVVFGKFRIEFCQGGRETPGVPSPESYEVVCGMTRNNSFVEQSATVGTPVADKCNNCFHGDTVILRFHIFAQNLGEITFPAFFVGFEPFLRIA